MRMRSTAADVVAAHNAQKRSAAFSNMSDNFVFITVLRLAVTVVLRALCAAGIAVSGQCKPKHSTILGIMHVHAVKIGLFRF